MPKAFPREFFEALAVSCTSTTADGAAATSLTTGKSVYMTR